MSWETNMNLYYSSSQPPVYPANSEKSFTRNDTFDTTEVKTDRTRRNISLFTGAMFGIATTLGFTAGLLALIPGLQLPAAIVGLVALPFLAAGGIASVVNMCRSPSGENKDHEFPPQQGFNEHFDQSNWANFGSPQSYNFDSPPSYNSDWKDFDLINTNGTPRVPQMFFQNRVDPFLDTNGAPKVPQMIFENRG